MTERNIGNWDPQIDFRINEKGGLAYLTYSTNIDRDAQAIIDMLDKIFTRVQF